MSDSLDFIDEPFTNPEPPSDRPRQTARHDGTDILKELTKADLSSWWQCPVCGVELSMRLNTDFPLTTYFYLAEGKKPQCYHKDCYNKEVRIIRPRLTKVEVF